ncbi:MAG: hypothetical protein RIF39_03050, partial [Cyclobacteriaceae bacterium]
MRKTCQWLISPLGNNSLKLLQVGIILTISILPIFFKYPFKINLFLAWEGAYRLYLGQIPHAEYYLPMGFGFWIIPALFFRLFGPSLFTLIITQSFINVISGLAFMGILDRLKVPPAKSFLALLVFCLSFVLVNFWPWYNHTVVVFQLIGLYFLLSYIFSDSNNRKKYYFILASFFSILAFFTKQDGGGFAIILLLVVLLTNAFLTRTFKEILYFFLLSIFFILLFTLPFYGSSLSYWFNYGQFPHNSRINLFDIVNSLFKDSQWIKFYLIAITIIVLGNFKTILINDKRQLIFLIITLFILGQAIVIQVTSYIPHNTNIYFHSFATAFILASLNLKISFSKPIVLITLCFLILIWWSSDSWRYGKRILTRAFPDLTEVQGTSGTDQVSISTWSKTDRASVTRSRWKTSNLKSFKNIYLPEETIQGIHQILSLDIVKTKDRMELKVLNMSELTPLAYEIG